MTFKIKLVFWLMKKNIGTVAPQLAVANFGSKSRCPVMLTYTSFCFSLYRWALPGSNFKTDVDRVHIIFFCFYWNPLSWEVNQASLSQKVAARWCSPIGDIVFPYIGERYRAATLKMMWIDFILFFFVSIENPSCEKWIKQVWVKKSLPGDAHL